MLREILRKITPYRFRMDLLYRFKLHGVENEKRLISIQNAIKSKSKVKILFVATTVPMWRGQNLFEILNNDPDFDVRIIISPMSRYNTQEGLLHVKALKAFFKSKNMSIHSTTDDGFCLDNWLNEFNPDVIFPAQHYEGLHGNKLDIEWNSDKLIVGVTTDDLVTYKGKHALIPFEDRLEIIRSIKFVDAVVPQSDMDKLTMCKKLGASILFVGDDWYGTDKWKSYEEEFNKEGIKIIYFPYTKGISSTLITQTLTSVRDNSETAIKREHLK